MTRKVERLIVGDKAELLGLLEWMRFFSLSNRNLGLNYDAVARRNGRELSRAFVDRLRLRNQESDAVLTQNNKENIAAKNVVNLDQKTLMKLAKYDLMKTERDYYFSKLRDIDAVLDAYKDSNVETLIQTIRDIIYLPQDKIGLVTSEGHLIVKGENEFAKFDENQNIAANFLGGDGSDQDQMGGFNFGSNIDLLNNKMDLEN